MTLPYVDADRIGVVGVCGGGAYAINATMTDRRIKAVGSVTGVNFGRLMHEAFSGYDPLAALDAIAEQRTAEARGAEPRIDQYLPADPAAAEEQGVKEIDLAEATDYYRTDRGRQPGGRTEAIFARQAPRSAGTPSTARRSSPPAPCASSSATSPERSAPTATAWRSTAAPRRRTSNSSSPRASPTTTSTTSPSRSGSPSTT